MKLLNILLSSLLLSISAHALTPYETMKKAFNESHDSIQYSDIRTEAMPCAYTEDQNATTAANVKIQAFESNKVIKPAIPAHPAQGPLLPGTPAVPAEIITKQLFVVMPANWHLASQPDLDDLFDNEDLLAAPTQLTLNMKKSNITGYAIVRKNGNLLTIYETATDEKESSEGYGYCWNP